MSKPGLLCPMTSDGRHKRKPWHDPDGHRAGLACERCHKTWQFVDDELVETYDLVGAKNG